VPQMQAWYMELIRQVNRRTTGRTLEAGLEERLGVALCERCRREWRRVTCRGLEQAARRLDALSFGLSGVSGVPGVSGAAGVRDGGARWLGWLGVDVGGKALAADVIGAVLVPAPTEPGAAAPVLRTYGVALCLIRFGLLGFEHCACAEALAPSTSPDAVAEALCAALSSG